MKYDVMKYDIIKYDLMKMKKTLAVLVFYWTTKDKLEFTFWSGVHKMFSCRENTVLQKRMMIAPPPHY